MYLSLTLTANFVWSTCAFDSLLSCLEVTVWSQAPFTIHVNVAHYSSASFQPCPHPSLSGRLMSISSIELLNARRTPTQITVFVLMVPFVQSKLSSPPPHTCWADPLPLVALSSAVPRVASLRFSVYLLTHIHTFTYKTLPRKARQSRTHTHNAIDPITPSVVAVRVVWGSSHIKHTFLLTVFNFVEIFHSLARLRPDSKEASFSLLSMRTQ